MTHKEESKDPDTVQQVLLFLGVVGLALGMTTMVISVALSGSTESRIGLIAFLVGCLFIVWAGKMNMRGLIEF